MHIISTDSIKVYCGMNIGVIHILSFFSSSTIFLIVLLYIQYFLGLTWSHVWCIATRFVIGPSYISFSIGLPIILSAELANVSLHVQEKK